MFFKEVRGMKCPLTNLHVRNRTVWLAPQIEKYLEWLEALRYSASSCISACLCSFTSPRSHTRRAAKMSLSCKTYIQEVRVAALEQPGTKAKTAVAVRKHPIDAECAVRQMLQLGCKETVTRQLPATPRLLLSFASFVPIQLLRGDHPIASHTQRSLNTLTRPLRSIPHRLYIFLSDNFWPRSD